MLNFNINNVKVLFDEATDCYAIFKGVDLRTQQEIIEKFAQDSVSYLERVEFIASKLIKVNNISVSNVPIVVGENGISREELLNLPIELIKKLYVGYIEAITTILSDQDNDKKK